MDRVKKMCVKKNMRLKKNKSSHIGTPNKSLFEKPQPKRIENSKRKSSKNLIKYLSLNQEDTMKTVHLSNPYSSASVVSAHNKTVSQSDSDSLVEVVPKKRK